MEINIELTDNQKLAMAALTDDIHRSIGYGGGAGGGKSFLGVIWLRMMCNKYPGVRYALCRDTIKNIKNTSVSSLEKFYGIYNVPMYMRGKMQEQRSQIVFPNGSVILLVEGCYYPSDPLYNRFGSLELTGAFIEESAEVPLDGIKILTTRVGRYMNEKYHIKGKVLETFNPNPGHVYERFYQGKGGDESIFIESLVYSNKFMDQGYIKNLEDSDESIKKRLLYGQRDFEDDTRMMFKKRDVDSLLTNPIEEGAYYIIADVARFGKDTTRIALRHGNNSIRVWTYEKNTTTEVIDTILFIAGQYGVDHRNIIVDADGVGGGVVDGIEYCTGFVNNSTPIVTGTKQNYANLKSQCAFMLKKLIENGELRISRDYNGWEHDWELLKQEMLNLYIDEKSIDGKTKIESKDKMKERIGRSPDLLDTFIMRMLPYIKGETYEIYEDYLYAIDR